jgi:hypothetical protein
MKPMDTKPIYTPDGKQLYPLAVFASLIGRTTERVRQLANEGERVIRDESYGFRLYRIADGYQLNEKGRIVKL